MLRVIQRELIGNTTEKVDGANIEIRDYRCPVMGVVREWWAGGEPVGVQIIGPVNSERVISRLRAKEERVGTAGAMTAPAKAAGMAPAALFSRLLECFRLRRRLNRGLTTFQMRVQA